MAFGGRKYARQRGMNAAAWTNAQSFNGGTRGTSCTPDDHTRVWFALPLIRTEGGVGVPTVTVRKCMLCGEELRREEGGGDVDS